MLEELKLGALLPEIILCIFALLIAVYDFMSKKKDKEFISHLAQIGFVATLIGVWSFIGGQPHEAYSGMIVIDNCALFLKSIILIVAVLSVSISHKFITNEGYESGEYYILMMFSVLGMMIMVSGADLISIFVGLELMAIPCYFLTGIFKKEAPSIEGALKYFLIGAFSSAVLLYGISFVYGVTGTTNLLEIANKVDLVGGNKFVFYLVISLLIAGFGFKIALVPFHMWCPDVYEGAPTPITAFMSTAVKAASFAVFLRVYATSLSSLHVDWAPVVAVLAAVTMTVGNVVALTQTNVKRLLAYSSIAHAGYILIGLVAIKLPAIGGGQELQGLDGFASVLFYLMVYSFMNIGPFAILIMLRTKKSSGETLVDLHGLSKRAPALAALMLLFMFALTGLPPTGGFVAKYYLFLAGIKANYLWLTVVACFNTAISAAYYFKICMLMYMHEPKNEEEIAKPSKSVQIALYSCAAATLIIGIFPGHFFTLAKESVMFLKSM